MGIGCDLMFQKCGSNFDDDIFILHADMTPHHEGWFEEVLNHVDKYPEAGMFGCLLLYPARNDEGDITYNALEEIFRRKTRSFWKWTHT